MPKFEFNWEQFYNRQRLEETKRRMGNMLKTVLGKEADAYRITESRSKQVGDQEVKEEWFFDANNKIIEYPKEQVSKQPGKKTIARLFHELAHAKYTETPEITQAPEQRTAFSHLCNTLEDMRIERNLMYNYPGTYDSFKKNKQRFQDSAAVEQIMYAPPYINFLFNLGQQEWDMPMYAQKGILEVITELEETVEEAMKCKDTQELVDHTYKNVWDKFYNLLIKNPPPQDGNQGQQQQGAGQQGAQQDQMQAGGGKGESGEGGGDPQKGEKGDQKDDKDKEKNKDKENKEDEKNKENEKDKENKGGEDGDQNKDDKGEGDGDSSQGGEQGSNQRQEDGNQNNDGKANKPAMSKKEKEKLREKMKDLSEKAITLDEISEYLEEEGEKQNRGSAPSQKKPEDGGDGRKAFGKDYGKKKDDKANGQWKNASQPRRTYEELFEAVQPQFNFFFRKLNSIMKDNQYTRHGGSFRSGKLNNKKLYRWKCNSGKLFSRAITRDHKNYAVTLLVDQSGSMCGERINRAAEGAVLMAEVLDRINIPFEVAGFDDDEPRLYKKLSEPFTWSHRRNMEHIIEDGHGLTNDAFAVNWAQHRLEQESGEKILIVLSDGSPNATSNEISLEDQKRLKIRNKTRYDQFNLKQEVMLGSKTSTIIGIGLHSRSVQDYYPNWSVIEEMSALPHEILHHVKANIRRG